mgnify:CR=1 FL=1
MLHRTLILGLLSLTALLAFGASAQARHPHNYCDECRSTSGMTHADRYAYHAASRTPWHGQYYHPEWNRPVALIVPQTANNYTSWGWGVGGTRVTPLYQQFGRAYPGGGAMGTGPLYPRPQWQSDTEQFGAYYIRAPW